MITKKILMQYLQYIEIIYTWKKFKFKLVMKLISVAFLFLEINKLIWKFHKLNYQGENYMGKIVIYN